MSKALLLIDRGSKEEDVKKEMSELCLMISAEGYYSQVKYCFLEVTTPYIKDGIESCSADELIIMPYFLYPGLKLKLAILESERIAKELSIKYKIIDCLHYHPLLPKIINKRVKEAKSINGIELSNKECDLLLIGHGSSDIDARLAFEQIYEEVRDDYRNTSYAFLELDKPNISDGMYDLLSKEPEILIVMPYFLHHGTHIKYDVIKEVRDASKDARCKVIMTEHIGLAREMVKIIMDKARGII